MQLYVNNTLLEWIETSEAKRMLEYLYPAQLL